MLDIASHKNSASALDSTSELQPIQHIHDHSTHVRQMVLALRQKKMMQTSQSARLGVNDASVSNPDRLTWFGVDNDVECIAPTSLSTASRSANPRHSDDEDDADSTVLGHRVQVLPLSPKTLPHTHQTQPHRATQISPPSPNDTCSSSRDSGSHNPGLVVDDIDAHSLPATTATDASSGFPSRRVPSARARTNPRRPSHNIISNNALVVAAPSTSSKPLSPPPSMPLPPRPSTPSTRILHSTSSRRSSRASALTTTSSRSSYSPRSSWKSSIPSQTSSLLIPAPSERSDTSDISDEELIHIRDITSHFPSTVASTSLPASISNVLEQSCSLASAKSRLISETSRTASQSPRSGHVSQKPLSSVHDSTMDPPLDTPRVRLERNSDDKGEESSDSALSDVLNLTDNKGILTIGRRMQRASLNKRVSVTSVGLGAGTLSRSGSEQLEIMRDVENAHVPKPAKMPPKRQTHHRRTSTMTKTMSELVAALDLEATEWGQRLGESESMDSGSGLGHATQTRESHLLDSRPPGSHNDPATKHNAEEPTLPTSDSTPSLSTSVSQELSLDDLRSPETVESSLIRSNSAKSTATADDAGAGAEFRSIYDAYRGSSSTMASRFTAPVVRIEDPQGDELSDPELEGGESSSDDMPRKRNKPSRRNRLGFEEQRAPLRPRPSIANRSTSLSTSRPSQTFHSTLESTQEEQATSSTPAQTAASSDGTDPYAFYEFSPSLPPFMPRGLSPRDLTGRGTWSSIVARASEHALSRQTSVSSLASFSTSTAGPVSMREIRATARAKQKQIDAAHRAREEMSEQFATMSYRPFAIHEHALSFVNRVGIPADVRSSVSSIVNAGGPESILSGRSSSMSNPGYADSVAPSVGDYGSRWPVAVGADQGFAPDDVASIFYTAPSLSSRRLSEPYPREKQYVEFSMQTSPQLSPSESYFPLSDSLTVDGAANHLDAEVGDAIRPSLDAEPATLARSSHGYLGIDAPLRRRTSNASLLSMHGLDTELEMPGLWPSRIRAPRLSSGGRKRRNRESTAETALRHETDSDEESELDVNANLEDLAERSGVLDGSRGSKRKLHSSAKNEQDANLSNEGTTRAIASIPARSRRISAALDRIRAQRISRNAGWGSSDDEDDDNSQEVLNTPRKTKTSSRPSLPSSVPSKVPTSANTLCRSKSMVSMGRSRRAAASQSMLRARSPSPDLSILTNPSDDEEVLLTANLELDSLALSHKMVLDEEFDMMVGQTITSRFSNAAKLKSHPVGSEASGKDAQPGLQRFASGIEKGGAGEDGSESSPEASEESRQATQLRTHSRTSSMSTVIEMIQEADELLSSTGHSIGNSSGHDTTMGESGGTSGHDPQKPNKMLPEIIRHRRPLRLQGLQTPATLPNARSNQADRRVLKDTAAKEDVKADRVEEDAMSPSTHDTPDTMVGSEIWTSFHADRSSTASTATTWSYRSTGDISPRAQSISTSAVPANIKEIASKTGVEAESAAGNASVAGAEQRERVSSTLSAGSSKKASLAETGASRATPVLRRKSSGLPVARSTLPKHQPRPSLPLPSKSDPLTLSDSNRIPAPGATMRPGSVANLRSRRSTVGKNAPGVADSTAASKEDSAGQNAKMVARHSGGLQGTPCKAGGGIAPSRLPSLRDAASTTSLRAQAAAQQTAGTLPARKAVATSGIPQRLAVPSGAGRA